MELLLFIGCENNKSCERGNNNNEKKNGEHLLFESHLSFSDVLNCDFHFVGGGLKKLKCLRIATARVMFN